MRTKILTPLLSFLLMQTASVMAANNQPQWADRLGVRLSPLNPAFEKYRSAQTAATKAQSSGPLNSREHRLGYIPPPFVFPANMGASGQTGVASANAAILPSRFDLRTSQPLGVTPVRNQYHCGSCWAFGTLGALESHLIYKKNKPTNYSEEDLILNNGFANGPCGGGNYAMAAAYLTRWGGPVSERDSPYAYWQGDWSWTIGSLGSNELPGGVTSPGSLSDTAGVTPPSPGIHIQKVKFLSASNQPLSTPERNTLKRAVMTDGAVGVIYWDMPFFYNESTRAFYNDTITDGNHAVTLVGWDDHFPRSAFNNSPPTDDYPFSVNPPPMDGAFIVKNSWGTEWGDEGYFYLSYFDTSLQQFTQFLEPETTSNYTRIYEYDPLGMVTAVGIDGAADPETAWMSNVFMASISAAKIKALGFYAVVPNTQYTIQIRTEVTVGSRNVVDPASGRLVGSASGTLADAGYNTVKLPEAARVTANRPFSVIVKLHTPGNQQPIPIETDKFAYRSRDATSAPGQSFISADGLIWKDAAYIPGTDGTDGISFNVNLKAFAVR